MRRRNEIFGDFIAGTKVLAILISVTIITVLSQTAIIKDGAS